jgi:hypothetical protein
MADSMHMGVLVERVAQAICNSLGGDQAWHQMPGTVRDNYLDCARAAIAEIKQTEYLRWCEWPDCLRSFNVLSGPKPATDGKGWIYVRTGMHVLLCPDHADTGHRPQHFEWESGDTTIRTSCECGALSGDLKPTSNARCTQWWREHVTALPANVCGWCDGSGVASEERFGRDGDGAPYVDGDQPCPEGCTPSEAGA